MNSIRYPLKFLLYISQFLILQVLVVKAEFIPVEQTEFRLMGGNYSGHRDPRQSLAPFQVCLPCKCCTTAAAACATMPCCFGIDCQLPNKPFGVCAFVPKTCNCTSCAG